MKIDDSEIQKLNRIYDFKQKNEENKIEYEKELEEANPDEADNRRSAVKQE